MAKDIGGLPASIGEASRGKGTPLEVKALGACDCGCNRPAGLEFRIGDRHIRITSPEVADQVIDGLAEMRAKLWGPRYPDKARDEEGAADAGRN